MVDVLIAGGGPAGAFAALILARAGLQVHVLERGRFPRAKLCGDTLNPGALATLARHLPTADLEARSLPIDGMVLTGPGGARIEGTYGPGLIGRAITRAHLDHWLIAQASAAGAQVEEQAAVTGAVVEERGGRRTIAGLVVRGRIAVSPMRARFTIGADGRRSTLAFNLGLARHPRSPRRWAIGAYFEGVDTPRTTGEMHVRPGYYVGVAPVPEGLTNACLVVPRDRARESVRNPLAALASAVAGEPLLAERFSRGRIVGTPVVLGPMAVDVSQAGMPGLMLAGDAAGFIDPITGDGLAFALRGAELAAATVLDVLGGRVAYERSADVLAARRADAFGRKLRFNRAIRRLVSWPAGLAGAAGLAHAWPTAFAEMIRFAGDCSTWTRLQPSQA